MKPRLTDAELEKMKRIVKEEDEARSWGDFKFVVSGRWSKGYFAHYNHVRNKIAKILNENVFGGGENGELFKDVVVT